MKIIYCHHALRKRGEIPTQQDGIEDLGIEDANIVAKLLVLANKNNTTITGVSDEKLKEKYSYINADVPASKIHRTSN